MTRNTLSTPGTIKRYILIIQKVMNNSLPSFQDLQEYLAEEGHDLSRRTLQRDLQQIKNEFGVEITYDRARNGYKLMQGEILPGDSLLRLIEVLGTAELFSEDLQKGTELLDVVLFENRGNLKGVEQLGHIIPAIRHRRVLVFEHRSYHDKKVGQKRVHPYFIKEYLGRWYLVGYAEDAKDFRTYGVDRISKLRVLEKTFRKDPKKDPRENFESVVGLVYEAKDIEEIQLISDATQAQYLESLPLHRSQVITKQGDNRFLVTLHVKRNYELAQRILMLGEDVTVLKPESLRKEIRNRLKNMLRNYSKS